MQCCCDIPVEMRLIRRRTLLGIGWHYGVRVIYADRWSDVYDFSSDLDVDVVSLAAFAGGRRVYRGRTLDDPHAVRAAWRRLQRVCDDRAPEYDLTRWNCEHFARYVIEGRRSSPQVRAAVGVALIGVGLIAAHAGS